MRSRRSRRSRRSQKLSHTQTSVPCGTLNKLTSEESNLLEGKLTLSELNTALKQMKNDKCPGIDGFPSEFFKLFWDTLKHFILHALNNAFDIGELSRLELVL